MEALYKGSLEAKADQSEVLLSLLTRRFRKVPYFQASATTKPSYVGQQYEKMHIPILFDGNKTNKFIFTAADGADLVKAAGAAGTQNVLFFVHRGYIIRDWSEAATIEMLRRRGLVG